MLCVRLTNQPNHFQVCWAFRQLASKDKASVCSLIPAEPLNLWNGESNKHLSISCFITILRLSCGLVLILCQCKPARDYVHSCTVLIIPSKWTLQDRSNVCRATCSRKAGGGFWTLFLGFWRHTQIKPRFANGAPACWLICYRHVVLLGDFANVVFGQQRGCCIWFVQTIFISLQRAHGLSWGKYSCVLVQRMVLDSKCSP